ncbi:MAG: NAD(P)/FAD-dependent oxidoreductase [Chloroflexi bacterium]|nr:NAD(P)/FAD-dependent oxidoreductase [Chloroflexota bacterium]
MPSQRNYRIIIAGAGPAGISTALHLAQIAPELIPHILVLEKARHPRPKLCGGGLLPDAEVILRHLGLDINEAPHTDVDWAHFDFEGKGMRMRGEKGGRFAFRTIRRPEFDAWLAARARARGILVQEDTCITGVLAGEEEVLVITSQGEYRAAALVGADGSNSVVRQAVAPGKRRGKPRLARLLEVVTGPGAELSPHLQPDSYFDFFVAPHGIQGYTWDFPALEKGKPARVRGVYDSNIHDLEPDMTLREALAQEFARHGLDLADYRLESHPIRWFETGDTFSAPRLLLAGDAAGVDALFGEGISPALGYGAIAAEAIREAFARDDFSFTGYRRRILSHELGKALRRRTWFARFFYSLRSPVIQSILWRRCGPLIEWIVRKWLIGWAGREERKRAS